jgi:hypothetical protein
MLGGAERKKLGTAAPKIYFLLMRRRRAAVVAHAAMGDSKEVPIP